MYRLVVVTHSPQVDYPFYLQYLFIFSRNTFVYEIRLFMLRSTFRSSFTTCVCLLCMLPILSGHAVRQPGLPSQVEFVRKDGTKPSSSLTQFRFTGDSCQNASECVPPRQCRAGGDECSGNTTDCKCRAAPDLACATSLDCDRDSRCIEYPNVENSECFPCNRSVNQLPENANAVDDGNCVCIATDLLDSLDVSSLVFKTHRRAYVLCDQVGNCATPAHIVIFRDHPMSMATYCARLPVSCRRAVKLVNSPKMKLGLRIPSRSKHLRFTAFAAARQTLAEEVVLRMMVALGL